MATSTTNTALNLALLLNRLSLGTFFVLAGYRKVFVEGMAGWMASYHPRVPGWLSHWIATPYGYALPFVELLVGGLLILGLFARPAAAVMALIVASVIIATASFLQDNGIVHPNLIYLTLAILLAITGPGRISIDAVWRKKR